MFTMADFQVHGEFPAEKAGKELFRHESKKGERVMSSHYPASQPANNNLKLITPLPLTL
jgi:hypothetical protein